MSKKTYEERFGQKPIGKLEVGSDLEVGSLKTKHLMKAVDVMVELGKKNKDAFTAQTENLKSLAPVQAKEGESEDELAQRRKEQAEKQGEMQKSVGVEMVLDALSYARAPLVEMMADLVGLTPEEFEETDLDVPFDIVDTITERDDLLNFYRKALKIAKKFTNK